MLTLSEAAELLQVEVAVISELAERGELPGRRLGGDWRFPRQALLDWLGGPSREDEPGPGAGPPARGR